MQEISTRRPGRVARQQGPGNAPAMKKRGRGTRICDQPRAIQVDDDGCVPDVRQLRHAGQSVRQSFVYARRNDGERTIVRRTDDVAARSGRRTTGAFSSSPGWSRRPGHCSWRPRIVPGVSVEGSAAAVVASLSIAILERRPAPRSWAGLRLPFMALLGFVLVLVLDALMLQLAAEIRPEAISVDDFGWALLAALVAAAVSVVLEVLFGTNDDDTYTLKVVRRIAKKQGGATRTDAPGIVFLEIDGLAMPVCAGRCATETRRTWRAGWPRLVRADRVGARPLVADRSQPGRHPARLEPRHPRLPLGGQGVGTVVSRARGLTTAPRSSASGQPASGLLTNGGSSRGNLLSGEADEVILTVSRISAEKKSNPGYRRRFSPTASTSRGRSSCSVWEIVLGSAPPCVPRGGTYALAVTGAASTPTAGDECASSCAT